MHSITLKVLTPEVDLNIAFRNPIGSHLLYRFRTSPHRRASVKKRRKKACEFRIDSLSFNWRPFKVSTNETVEIGSGEDRPAGKSSSRDVWFSSVVLIDRICLIAIIMSY